MSDVIAELDRLLDQAGLTPKLGLVALGHVPAVVAGLRAGDSWVDIGARIGWEARTLRVGVAGLLERGAAQVAGNDITTERPAPHNRRATGKEEKTCD